MTRILAPFRLDPARVDAELDEELSFHLSLLARDLESRGLSPDAAAAEARRRFGDAPAVARRCRAIILKEQTMLRRLHLALTITLAALLILTVVVGFSASRRARDQAVRAREMEMQARLEAEKARDAQEAVSRQLQDQLAPATPQK